jgi:hypothetical protein
MYSADLMVRHVPCQAMRGPVRENDTTACLAQPIVTKRDALSMYANQKHQVGDTWCFWFVDLRLCWIHAYPGATQELLGHNTHVRMQAIWLLSCCIGA